MAKTLFSIKDTKSKLFGLPVTSENEETFKDEVLMLFIKGIDNLITQFPSRFQLYKLGVFDETGGSFVSHQPIYICNGLDIKQDYIKHIQENQPCLTELDDEYHGPEIPEFTPSLSGDEDNVVCLNR